jgi:hypothetical protein
VSKRDAKSSGIVFEDADPMVGQKVLLQNNDDINFLKGLKKLISIRAEKWTV